MRFRSTITLLLLSLAVTVGAQKFIGGPIQAPVELANPPAAGDQLTPQQRTELQGIQMSFYKVANQPTVMAATDRYVYFLRNGVLVQYDGQALKAARLLELDGPLPAKPADDAPFATRLKFGLAVVKRSAAPALVVSGGDLVIATFGMVYDVDAVTLKLKSTTDIAQADRDNLQLILADLFTAPQLQVTGRIAYIMQAGNHLATVALDTGKMLPGGKLPEAMNPAITPQALLALFQKERQGMFPGGGFRNPPGGGGAVDVPQTVTLIGTMHHVEQNGGFWAFDDRNGLKYSLTGDKLKELAATPNIEGARVRITGTINNAAEAAQYGNGAFTVTAFTVMPAAE